MRERVKNEFLWTNDNRYMENDENPNLHASNMIWTENLLNSVELRKISYYYDYITK